MRGFSLIELLVVVAIISVLASIGLVGYQTYIDTSRDEVTLSDFRSLEDMLNTDKISIDNDMSGTSSKSEGMTQTSLCEDWRDLVITTLNAEKESSFGGVLAVDGNNCGTNDNQSSCGDNNTKTWKRGQIMLYCADECQAVGEGGFKIKACVCRQQDECTSVVGTDDSVCTTPPDGRIC